MLSIRLESSKRGTPRLASTVRWWATVTAVGMGLVCCGTDAGSESTPTPSGPVVSTDAAVNGMDGDASLVTDAPTNVTLDGGDASSLPDAGVSIPQVANVVSYLGGGMGTHPIDDQGRDVVFDAAGNMYITGGLYLYQGNMFQGATGHTIAGTSGRGSEDIFVLKLSPAGALLYATLIGGPNYDRPYAIEVDAQGRAYVAGRAGAGFPSTNSTLQPTFAGDTNPNPEYGTQDGFVLRLAADGGLDWATYVGDSGSSFIRDIAIDSVGDVYAGVTNVGASFPHVTPGTLGPTGSTKPHAAIVKLSGDGKTLIWGTHLGGTSLNGNSGGTPSIRVNAAKEPFMIYSTFASNEATANAAQSSLGGGEDAFAVHLSANGATLLYGTYVGGAGDEGVETHDLDIDNGGRAYLLMSSTSLNAVTAADPAPYRKSRSGAIDLMLVRLSANGSTFEAATMFGGSAGEQAQGIAIDPGRNRVYFSGSAASTDFPTTNGTRLPGAFVTALDLNLQKLIFSTALGGSGSNDEFRSVAVDANGAVGVAGQTNSTDIMTRAPIQSTYGGGNHDVLYARYNAP